MYSISVRSTSLAIRHKFLSFQKACLFSLSSVVTPSQSRCSSAALIQASNHGGHLTSVTSQTTGCGLASAPWILETASGQQIQLTFLLFAWQQYLSDADTAKMRSCDVKFGYVIDLQTQSTELLCGDAGNERHKQQITSKGNRLQIVLDQQALDVSTFLLQYQGAQAVVYALCDVK